MKKSLCVILALIALIIFSGCSKKELNYTVTENNGVKTYRNKNIPSQPELKITPRELFTISCQDENSTDSTRIIRRFNDFDIDTKNNIYINDNSNNTLKKFDSRGNFIKSFGGKGKGPGETEVNGWMMVLQDTVILDDYLIKEMVKYDSEGNYLCNNRTVESGPFERFQELSKDKVIGYQVYYEEVDDELHMSYNLTIMNSNFTKYKQIASKKITFVEEKYNFFDHFLSAYATSDSLIFFAEKSDSKYKINVYDHETNHKYSVTKNYARIQFNEEEFSVFENEYKDIWYFSNNKSRFKSAIIQMEYDKYGRLWVFSSVKRDEKNQTDLLVDIFKDGIFLKQVKLDICPGSDFVNYDHMIRLLNDRLYYVNTEDQYMKVYDY
ncbi:MAG: 6-bladed beta-propeller [Candidatus Delongbacteria bacterium]|jgi:hypothetical protein|nr:6-bladed beta-propeller [Candidatus Delongbacteria bacterium]